MQLENSVHRIARSSFRAGWLVGVIWVSGCVVESSRPPVVVGDGLQVDPDSQVVSIDRTKVAAVDTACAEGEVLQKTADGWACQRPVALDPEHIPNIDTCAVGEVVVRAATGWECRPPTDVETTPVVASCPEGRFVHRTANGWDCIAPYDPEQVPVLDTCPAGRFIQKLDIGWTCADPIDPEAIPVLAACAPGTFVQKLDTGWTCAAAIDPTRTPVLAAACPSGQFVQKTTTGWGCAVPLDPAKTPVIDSCPVGQFVVKTANGWACGPAYDPNQVPLVIGCQNGQFVQRSGTGWACGPAFDPTQVPVVAVCPGGQFIKRNSVGWECGLPPVDATATPVVTACLSGQLVSKTVAGWACVDAPPDISKTPIVDNCAGGQWVKRTDTGWACTPLTGPLTGDVTGNVVGNVTGNVTGNLTGDVSGTAQNVRGVVAVANGGTGLSSVAAGALLVGGTTTLDVVLPTAGTVLAAVGGAWQPKKPIDLGLARRSTAGQTIYVRTDGSDANCDGTANTATGANRNCAVATLQRAIDLVPEFVDHAVDIRLAAGTYTVSSGPIAVVSKQLRQSASVNVIGSGTVVLDAADGGSGIQVSDLGGPFTLTGLTIRRATGDGLLVTDAQVVVSGVTVSDCAGAGVHVRNGGQVDFSGLLTLNLNRSQGALVESGSFLQGAGGLVVTNNTGNGVEVKHGSALYAAAPTDTAVASATISTNGGYGVMALSAWAGFAGKLDMIDNVNAALRGEGDGGFSITGQFTIAGPAALTSGVGVIDLIDNSQLGVNVQDKAGIVRCGSGGSAIASTTGIRLVRDSSMQTGGGTGGTIDVRGCATGVALNTNAVFIGDTGGTRSFTNTTKTATAVLNSVYASSNFADAVAADCTTGSQCN